MPVKPVKASKLMYFVSFDDGTTFQKMTEMNSIEFDRETETYDTEYVDYEEQMSFVVSSKTKGNYEIDLYEDGELQTKLLEYENKTNVPVKVVRLLDIATPLAQMAPFSLNSGMLKSEPNGIVKLPGELDKTGEWVKGSFDKSALKFTPTPGV